MEKFTTITGLVCPLDRADVDAIRAGGQRHRREAPGLFYAASRTR